MEFKFYVNPDTGQPHILDHHVTPEEIFEFFSLPFIFELPRPDGSFEAYGRLSSGRFLHVPYRKFPGEVLFIITAFDLQDRQIIDKLIRELE